MSENAEQRLAAFVVGWLQEQHWEVYQEVKFGYGGVADIAAVRAGLLWTIECKTTLTFKVLEQASGWRAHFRSIAVPKARGDSRWFALHLAKEYLKVGVLTVDGPYVAESPAPLMREHHRMAKRMMGELREEQKTWCKAGSASGGYYTPYRDTMRQIQRFIGLNPGCTLKEIMEEVGKGHYANKASARNHIPTVLETIEQGWCRVERDGKIARFFLREVK